VHLKIVLKLPVTFTTSHHGGFFLHQGEIKSDHEKGSQNRNSNAAFETILKLSRVFIEASKIFIFIYFSRQEGSIKCKSYHSLLERHQQIFIHLLELRFSQIFDPNRGERIFLPSLYVSKCNSGSSETYNYLFTSKRKVYFVTQNFYNSFLLNYKMTYNYNSVFTKLRMAFLAIHYTVKNVSEFPVTSRDVTNQALPGWK
jgi:hypothetical protein